jgi:hypothetical protein
MTDERATDVGGDVDPTDGRNETLNERMDRNWNEILQELRVTQTGTQIFTVSCSPLRSRHGLVS